MVVYFLVGGVGGKGDLGDAGVNGGIFKVVLEILLSIIAVKEI